MSLQKIITLYSLLEDFNLTLVYEANRSYTLIPAVYDDIYINNSANISDLLPIQDIPLPTGKKKLEDLAFYMQDGIPKLAVNYEDSTYIWSTCDEIYQWLITH